MAKLLILLGSVLLSGCMAIEKERMMMCKYMCDDTGVQKYSPISGDCFCRVNKN